MFYPSCPLWLDRNVIMFGCELSWDWFEKVLFSVIIAKNDCSLILDSNHMKKEFQNFGAESKQSFKETKIRRGYVYIAFYVYNQYMFVLVVVIIVFVVVVVVVVVWCVRVCVWVNVVKWLVQTTGSWNELFMNSTVN